MYSFFFLVIDQFDQLSLKLDGQNQLKPHFLHIYLHDDLLVKSSLILEQKLIRNDEFNHLINMLIC
jgi:hypothetical protein